MRKLSTNTVLRELQYCIQQDDINKIAFIKQTYDINQFKTIERKPHNCRTNL
jgi:hypothetical protein